MKKKKLTNKEITKVLDELSNNDQILWKEILELKQFFVLNLERTGELDKFNKFVKAKVKEFEKQQRSKITKGA